MAAFYYNAEQFLPISMEKAWDFFSSAENLAVITPPEMQFNILTKLDGSEIYEGMLIEYKLKPLLGITVRWKTEICKVDKPIMFTDRQLKGPYKLWEHTHTFIKKENGILMKDQVKYELPFGVIGRIMHSIVVRKKIENIFKYREKVLKKIFKENANTN